jgi:hypothetical protein
MQVAVPNTCQSPRSLLPGTSVSVLSQCFADPARGEFVLAHDASGVDPQKDVDAVPGPFSDLGGVDAAVGPGGQARVAQVVGPPGEGEACSVAVSAAWRALIHARRYVIVGSSPPRTPLKRPRQLGMDRGAEWTDDGSARERRQLKHRPEGDSRIVAASGVALRRCSSPQV